MQEVKKDIFLKSPLKWAGGKAKLMDKKYPYDYEEVITEREKIRAEINELEEKLKDRTND